MTDPACPLPDAERDPGGVPFAELAPERLRAERSSIKWRRFPEDVLPLFVAEMDFPVAGVVQQAIVDRVRASDTGYLDGPGGLAPAFAGFARDRWGWDVPAERIHLATDVATGIVESLRAFLPRGGRIIVPTPAYPSFFEMLDEVPFEVVEIPLAERSGDDGAPRVRLDLPAIARAFAEAPGIDAFLLCNPHNPHGLVHASEELAELARLAAAHDVLVVSDEIHAPLSFAGVAFTPFAPLAAAAGALSVTATSASKGWNLAGTKCSVLVAADDRANATLRALPPEVACRSSILGLHAGVAAFRDARDWLDRAVAQFEANDRLLAGLVAERLPGVRYTRPRAGYLAWLDFRDAGLGADPCSRILHEARVALNDGAHFGAGGAGHVRLNLACAPDTIRRAIDRIAAILPGTPAATAADRAPAADRVADPAPARVADPLDAPTVTDPESAR
ncbi:aminotransferase class I/II-fold pyridoxal phosphate-dependent enzyme [Leucobacter allii]|uniref:cysteine-S-conjugate beta-lyase n=1 Tax=Leucobacter allii TaxID=2932247 RepID=A0ABY4FJB1_9MICO|nr:aminotransferase class I/II-fold pyridoxal phosphate-dependent enzyme [Leucobacter allii]UOQ56608.1 aminotransferase class I/II-fold pyridoxal phosphate-dependent enzyme [Leucobacter allii]